MAKFWIQFGVLAVSVLCVRAASGTPYNATKDTGTFIPEAATKVAVEEKLGETVPLDLAFTDDSGNPVTLGRYFDGSKKPVVLQLGYFGCPMSCDMISSRLLESLGKVGLSAGKDFEVLYVSFDPEETPALAAKKKAALAKDYARGDGAGFHLLTGKGEQIERLTGAVGYQYKWVPQANQYSHPSVLILLMPDGKVSRYLYWPKFDSQTLRLSLVEASDRKIGTTADKFLLTCFRYDGRHGRYAMVAVRAIQAGGVVTVLVLGSVLVMAFRWEAKRRSKQAPGRPAGEE